MHSDLFYKMQEIAQMGSYETDLVSGTWTGSEHFIKMFELPDKEIYTEQEFQALVHPDDFKDVMRYFKTCLENQQDFNYEYRCLTKSGKVIYVISRSEVHYDNDGRPLKIVGIKQDITERKQAELNRQRYTRELEIKNNELEQFAYAASHDLQEPLRTVSNFTGLLTKEYRGKLDDKADQYISYIEKATSRLSRLINDLLEYSRIGKEKELTLVDCQNLIQQIRDDLHVKIEETKANITVEELPQVKGYHSELQLLFQNLIDNAMKFRKDDAAPRISIEANSKADHVQFSVKDNGIGLVENHQQRIFTLFQRLHGSKAYEGTGVGLAQCRKIVELHEGNIWVDSTAGEGSTFHFIIPNSLE